MLVGDSTLLELRLGNSEPVELSLILSLEGLVLASSLSLLADFSDKIWEWEEALLKDLGLQILPLEE